MRLTRILAAGAIGAAVVVGVPSLAYADQLTVTPASVAPGGKVTITMECQYDFDTITGEGPFAGITQSVGTQEFTVPANAAAGTYKISLVCEGSSGTPYVQSVTVTGSAPTPKPTPSGAPNTGGGGTQDSHVSLVGGLTLFAAAGVSGLVLLRRRRHG